MSTFGPVEVPEDEGHVPAPPPTSPADLVVTPAQASTGRRPGDDATVTPTPQ